MDNQSTDNKKMKVYFDGVLYSWGKTGGVLRYFNELIKYLSKTNETIVVLHEPNYGIDMDLGVTIKNIKIFGIHWPIFLIKYVRKIFVLLNNYKINKYFKGVEEGIFHSTYFTTYKNLKIPQVVTVHDMAYEKLPRFFSSRGHKRFVKNKKLCIDRASAVICVSQTTKDYLKRIYQVPDEKLFVIYHGVSEIFNLDHDPKVFEGLSARLGLKRPFFLFVGVRDNYKNFPFFIEAFSKLPNNKKYDIVAVGGGAFTKNEVKLFRAFKIMDQIKQVPFISEIELKSLYGQCQAFVFPSFEEGFGLPLLEAVSCGATVVVSDIPVFREIIKDLPIYFDPNDSDSLVKALVKATLLSKNYQTILNNAEQIKNDFKWSVCAEKTAQLYHQVIEKSRK